MIAAVAVARGLPLYTSNPRDFSGIEGLVVVPVVVDGTDDPGGHRAGTQRSS